MRPDSGDPLTVPVKFFAKALLGAAASCLCMAAGVPAPVATDFLQQVGAGQFDPHLELHLSQYAASPGWFLDFAGARATGSAIFGEFGSTTARHLFTNTQVALNLPASEHLQARYERRITTDERYDLQDERLVLSWFPGDSWAVVVSGWPTHLKEQASLGFGLRLGGPRGPNTLEVLVISEKAFWNEKTEGPVRFTREPLRLLMDGSWTSGPWRVGGSLDLGRAWESETALPEAVQHAGGHLRHGRLVGEYQGRGWALGGRLFLVAQRTEQSNTEPSMLDRRYGRIEATGRRAIGATTLYGLLGFAAQRETFAAPGVRAGNYRLGSTLAGIEGGWRWRESAELRLGYLGHRYAMSRASRFLAEAEVDPILADRTQEGWADKVHGRLFWNFRPGMSLELLLSQTVSGSRFGGGSVNMRFVF